MEYDISIFSKFTILAYLLDSKKFNYQQFQKIFSYGVIFLLASTVFFTPYSLSPYSSQFAFALSDSELLNMVGLEGDITPQWYKSKIPAWIIQERTSQEEFENALNFFYEKGLLNSANYE